MSMSRPSGLASAPQLSWGAHVAHFFSASAELSDVLTPYFKAGLESNERCLWVTGPAFNAEAARAALRAAMPDFDRRERNQQIEIADADTWYSANAKLRPAEIVSGLLQREEEALSLGYEGVRTNGNCAWVSPAQWADFQDYETLVASAMRGRRMICMCSYCQDTLEDRAHLEIMSRHDLVLPSRGLASAPHRRSKPVSSDVAAVLEALPAAIYMTDAEGYLTFYNQAAADIWGWRPELGKQRWCGTWKIFSFDGAAIAHDQCPMAMALQTGNAMSGVEAEAERPDGVRVPCAVYPTPLFDADGHIIGGVNFIVDLSRRKAEEARSSALVGEMHHRVNNTLAIVMAIMGSTMRGVRTMKDFREKFTSRIAALSKTHSLLTSGAQENVALRDLLASELQMFAEGDDSLVQLSGPDVSLSARVAVPIGMALHELTTNAAKYGALSVFGGRILVDWTASEDSARLQWRETNVPMPAERKRVGFGTQLLTEVLPAQVGGAFKLTYESDGLAAVLEFPLR